ncbi:MAG: transcriptional repressor LexA [Deltaproteobacteria bacterium]|nr:transcriptional repressor LexA [Deltaproteobacteria bacterium]
MEGLTARQNQVLRYVAEFLRDHGYPPTNREIAAHLGLKSPNTVHVHLKALEAKGFIRIQGGANRGIRILKAPPEFSRGIPLVGKIAAGRPIESPDIYEEPLEVDREFFGHPASFCVRVHGDSMIEAHIADGDYVIIRPKPQPDNGDIVAALMDGEVTLKIFYRTRSGIELRPANKNYAPLYLTPDAGADLRILGVMAGLVRRV